MNRILFILLCALLACTLSAHAQQATSDFYDDPTGYQPASEPLIFSDLELFTVPVETGYDLFSRMSSYNFSATRYARRGYDPSFSTVYVNGLDLSDAISGRLNYSLAGALRYVPGIKYNAMAGTTGTGIMETVGWAERYSVFPSGAPAEGRVTLLATDRIGQFGARAALAGHSPNDGWHYSLLAGGRWGRDGHVQGVFTQEAMASVAVERKFKNGASLSLFTLAAPTERAYRSASTQEAFDLTGDNLYNPSWGWFEGKERSSRVRNTLTPMGIASFLTPLGDKSHFLASFSYTGGESSYSGLSWYDAQSPLPDYYRLMPSYIAEPNTSAGTAAFWRKRDPKVTQIDWAEMSYQNQMAEGQAVYVADEDVERFSNFQFMAGVTSHPDHRLTVGYGVRARLDNTENYKRLKDLLGAEWVDDVDQFLVDDEFYGDMARNNLRDPDHRAIEGDAFSYDYNLSRTAASLYSWLDYGTGRVRVKAGVELGNVALQREGFYEKELFAGDGSYGLSEKLGFFEYDIKLGAGYSIGSRQSVDATLTFASHAPLTENIFLQPRYCNFTVDRPEAFSVSGGELSYRVTARELRIKLTGFYTRIDHQTDIRHYYDDLSSTYSNLVMSGISTQHYGFELGAELALLPRLALLAGFSAGSYTYANDPRMDLYDDANAQPVYTGESAPLAGLRLGSTPQTVASGELRYSGRGGWLASVTLNYMADSYISVDPTHRMSRATFYAPSPETLTQMTSQERFDAAATVGVFVCKWFKVGGNNFMALLSVSNLLDNRNIRYSGYEQMRLHRSGNGIDRTYEPFASKYMYSYPRTFYCSLTYKF